MAVRDVLQEQLDFLARNDVADVLGIARQLNANPIMLSPTTAGPPLLPGLMAASI